MNKKEIKKKETKGENIEIIKRVKGVKKKDKEKYY